MAQATLTSRLTLIGEASPSPPGDELLEAPFKIWEKPEQKPVSVTLNGTAILLLASLLSIIVHFVHAHLIGLLVALAVVVVLVQNDYNNYLGLGPGGTPSTFLGYLRISWLRLWTLRDPYQPPKVEPGFVPKQGLLSRKALSHRRGPPPRVVGIAPQRQLDQFAPTSCFIAARRTLEKLSEERPDEFRAGRSCIEKHGLALFARNPIRNVCQGEVCHVHDTDNSMHMSLHPDDIKEILEKGWGQRHPVAWEWGPIKMRVSPYFVMVYAPRDEDELQSLGRIIEAAIWYTTAKETEVNVVKPSA